MRVIGVGNRWRGDDGAGLETVRRLGRLPGEVEAICHEGDGSGLIELWRGADAVVVVDAVRSGAAPGTVHRFDAGAVPLPRTLGSGSSHAVGVAEAIELARSLDRLPRRVVVYGVEGVQFEAGARFSEAVAGAIDPLARRVASEAKELARAANAG